MTVTGMLDQLADLYADRDLLNLQQQELIDSILTPEIRKQIEDIKAEFSGKSGQLESNITNLEAAVRAEVSTVGATVKGTHVQAVYSKGRISWDTKMLEGLMMVIPQVKEARREGEPSVSLRRLG